MVLRGEVPDKLAGLDVPHLDALEGAAVQVATVDGKGADGVLVGRHRGHHLQTLHVPHLDAVIHGTTEQRLLPVGRRARIITIGPSAQPRTYEKRPCN